MLTRDQLRWHRLVQSGLAGDPFERPAEAAHAHFGIQAQINSAARLALWHRLGRTSESQFWQELDREIADDRSLVRIWGQRGTLHLHDCQDWPIVSACVGARVVAGVEKRIQAALSKGESRNRADHESTYDLVRELLENSPEHRAGKSDVTRIGKPSQVREVYGVFLRLTFEGAGYRSDEGDNQSPEISSRLAYLSQLEWRLPPLDKAMSIVARRYFSTYGPARELDFRYWLGCTAGESKSTVGKLEASGELERVDVETERGSESLLVSTANRQNMTVPPSSPDEWPVRLLGRFDPLVLAHKDKSIWIASENYKRVWHHTHVEALLLIHGRIAGVWRYRRRAAGLTIDIEPFDTAARSKSVRQAVEEQASSIAGLFETELTSINYL